MDQDTVVSEQIDSGMDLIHALADAGFEVEVAFWGKPIEQDKWYLNLASAYVDEHGPADAYRLVLGVLRTKPDLWIDAMEVNVLGLNDSVTTAALAKRKTKLPNTPFAVQNRKPYPGGIWVKLESVSIERAYIYPPMQPAGAA